MQTPAEYFNKHRYVNLSGVLSEEYCKKLCDYMFDLHEKGFLFKDEQCPLSDSIYGDPEFDNLLDKLAQPIGEHIGLKLLPTYTYARIYRKGEVLKNHRDRPSCEISGTMTLGYDGTSVWPIYFGSNPDDTVGKRIDLGIGDLLMYRGEELPHWRPEFKGEWQIQVFFHYVNADGPHKDYIYDQRPQLGLPASSKEQEVTKAVETRPTQFQSSQDYELVDPKNRLAKFPIFNGVMIPSWDLKVPGVVSFSSKFRDHFKFTDEECDKIIAFSNEIYMDPAGVGMGDQARVDKRIRNVNLYDIPLNDKTKWVFEKLSRAVSLANGEYYNFEIMGICHGLQLLHYEVKDNEAGHYNWHVDIGDGESATRKLSVSVQLSNESDYTGCELLINSNGELIQGTKERGAITFFPSYMVHRVEPIKSGNRWALVIWVHGSNGFR